MSRNTRAVQEQVAENRNETRKIDSFFMLVSTQNDRTISLTRNFIEVEIETEVYERDLGGGLISGHPNGDEHGSGHGVSGDTRQQWEVQSVTIDSEQLVRGGRNSIRDALAGEEGAVSFVVVGSDGTSVSSGDESLVSEEGQVFASGLRDDDNETRARSMPFLFAEYGEEYQEFGVVDQGERLMSRSVLDAVRESSREKELRVDTTFSIQGTGVGDSVITNEGRASVADAIQLPGTTVGFEELAFGNGETDPSVTDTSLDNELFRKGVVRDVESEQVIARTKVYENEPSVQPVDFEELGVYDNNDRLLYRALIRSFEKTDQFEVLVTVGFNVRST